MTMEWWEIRDWLNSDEHRNFLENQLHQDNCGACEAMRIEDEENRRMFNSLTEAPTREDYRVKNERVKKRVFQKRGWSP